MKARQHIAWILTAMLLPWLAHAQEPTFMEAATHPGARQSYARALAFYSEYEEAGQKVKESEALLKFAYGITARWAALADLHGKSIDKEQTWDTGLSTATLRLKHRLFKHDTGPINTWMASILGGIEIPGPERAVAPARAAGRLGAATTVIRGRHGANLVVDWTSGSKRADTLDINTSYLYRLAPARYAADTKGAWYISLESLNTFKDNNDRHACIAPGLLYEARRWAAEIAVKLPWHEKGDTKLDAQAALGARYLF